MLPNICGKTVCPCALYDWLRPLLGPELTASIVSDGIILGPEAVEERVGKLAGDMERAAEVLRAGMRPPIEVDVVLTREEAPRSLPVLPTTHPPDAWERLIGRTHREGQAFDHVRFTADAVLEEDQLEGPTFLDLYRGA